MFDSLADEWQVTTLRAAAGELFTDGDWVESKDQDPNGEVRLVQLADIGDGAFLDKSARFLTAEKAHELRCTLLQPGDLLIARMADPIARCCIFPGLDQPAATVVDVSIVRPGPGVDRDYLSYAVSSHAFRSEALGAASGTTRSRISRSNLGQIALPLPPFEEQRRIAEVLRSVDEAIASIGAALDQIGRARAAILHDAFEDSPWEPVALGDLGRWQSGSTPAKGIPENWGGGIPWVCPRDMKVPLLKKTSETISERALGGSCRVAPVGTLMLVVRGMILARAIPTAITAVEATYNQDIKAFLPNGRASARFVGLCIRHQEVELLRLVNTATHGTKKLDSNTIGAIQVPLPDVDVQRALVQTIETLDEAAADYAAEHRQLSEVRRGLLSDLLSGRVRVPA